MTSGRVPYNMTNGADGNGGFNNSATLYNNQNLYNFVRDYLEDMYAMSPRYSDSYNTSLAPARGYYTDASASVYVSPELDSDLVVQRIDADVWTPAGGDDIFVRLGEETVTTHPMYDSVLAHFNDGWNSPYAVTITGAN